MYPDLMLMQNRSLTPLSSRGSRWVRTRCALLALFWLGWLGMLAGAVIIILQAPRCRTPPAVSWWNQGPLYQIGDVQAFADNLPGIYTRLHSRSKQYVAFIYGSQ